MASRLRERLKLAGGQLAETSAEELAQLTGRSQAPTTPLETGVIGGNQDQAKMAGTAQQRTSALRTAIQGEQDLGTALRREQVRRKATAGEQEKLTSEERLEQLGGLEGRVQQLAEQALVRGAEQEQQVTLEAAGEDQAVLLLNRIRNNPGDNDAIREFNNLMGRQRVGEMLSSQEILSNFDVTIDPATGQATLGGRGFEEIGGALAESVQDKITSGELNFQDMGFANIDEVAELLGTDAAGLAGMSITEMSEQLEKEIANEYSQVAGLQSKINDPALGAAERAEARKSLREAGAVGIRSAETDVDMLAEDIAEANTVEFLGEEITTEELLDNDYVSGLVMNYFQDENFKKELEQAEPQLVEFIKKHENLLLDSVRDIDQRIGDFAKIQHDNLSLQKTADGEELDEDIMKAWYGDFGELRSDRYEPNAAINYMKGQDSSVEGRQSLKESLNLVKETESPLLMQMMGQLNNAEIKNPMLTDRNSAEHQSLKTYLTVGKRVQQLDLANDDEVAGIVGAENSDSLTRNLQESEIRERSGFFGETADNDKLREIFQAGESMADAGRKLKENYFPGGEWINLRALLGGAATPSYDKNYSSVQQFAEKPDKIYQKVKTSFIDDDRIDDRELTDIRHSSNLDDLNQLYNHDKVREKSSPNFEKFMMTSGRKKLAPKFDKYKQEVGGIDVSKYQAVEKIEDYATVRSMFDNIDNYIKRLQSEKLTSAANNKNLNVKVIDEEINKYLNLRDRANRQAQSIDPLIVPEVAEESGIEEFINKLPQPYKGMVKRATPERLKEYKKDPKEMVKDLGMTATEIRQLLTKDMGIAASEVREFFTDSAKNVLATVDKGLRDTLAEEERAKARITPKPAQTIEGTVESAVKGGLKKAGKAIGIG